MRKFLTVSAVLAALTALLSFTGSANAVPPGYDARAHLGKHRTCHKYADMGVTKRLLLLHNKGTKKVQYHVFRDGDYSAAPVRYVWVKPGQTRKLAVRVPQRKTVAVLVRVPEMGHKQIRLSKTVEAKDSCYVPTLDPRASLGGVSCVGGDSVAQILLDNRGTSNATVDYAVTSSFGHSSATFSVSPASSVNDYLPVPAGKSTHVKVTVKGKSLLSLDVAATNCP